MGTVRDWLKDAPHKVGCGHHMGGTLADTPARLSRNKGVYVVSSLINILMYYCKHRSLVSFKKMSTSGNRFYSNAMNL